MENLANVGATAISYYFGILFACLALFVVYIPVCTGICWVGEKILPYNISGSKEYGYVISIIFGVGGIAFMYYAVNFLRF